MDVDVEEIEGGVEIKIKNADRAVLLFIKSFLEGDQFSSVVKEHPQADEIKLVVKGKNPKKIVQNAIKQAERMLDELEKQIS
ncbi:MAG: hypothetical protein QXL16_00355 [Candidatus Micrarchaeaceae archaeon]